MLLWVISVLLLNSSEVYPSARFTLIYIINPVDQHRHCRAVYQVFQKLLMFGLPAALLKIICQINSKQLIPCRFVDKSTAQSHSSCYNEEFMCCFEWLECLSSSYNEFYSSARLNYIYHYLSIDKTAQEWPANFFSALGIWAIPGPRRLGLWSTYSFH